MKKNIAVLLFISIIVFVSWNTHRMAGFGFPIPWPDESSFVWPAISFAEKGTMFAPQINPERTLMWMPPGYMMILGGILKFTEFTPELTRWVSWACVMMAFIIFSYWLLQFRLWFLTIPLAAGVFLNGTFTVAGNITRMDSMVLLLAVVAFLLLWSGRQLIGFFILFLTPLVHPNGMYFLTLALLARIFVNPTHEKPKICPIFILSGLVLSAWVFYAFHVAENWGAFIKDMNRQFGLKGQSEPFGMLFTFPRILYVLIFAGSFFYCAIKKSQLVWFVGFGAAAMATSLMGQEMWYLIFRHIGFVVLASMVLWAIPFQNNWVGKVCVGVTVILIWFSFHRQKIIPNPIGYPDGLTFFHDGMVLNRSTPYITDGDIHVVSEKIKNEFPAGSNARIVFFPAGDGLFFIDKLGDHASPYDPTFTKTPADGFIVHVSRHRYQWWSDWEKIILPQPNGLESSLIPGNLAPFYTRDSSEKWFFIKEKKVSPVRY